MADESGLIAEYLYGKLNVSAVTNALGTAARIYDTFVPQSPITGQTLLFPCIVFQQQAGVDVWGVGARRIFVRPLWTVKVILDSGSTVYNSFKHAGTIFSIVDATLQNTSGAVTDGSIYSCYRDSDSIRYTEPKPAGGYFLHRGAMFRIEARATVTP